MGSSFSSCLRKLIKINLFVWCKKKKKQSSKKKTNLCKQRYFFAIDGGAVNVWFQKGFFLELDSGGEHIEEANVTHFSIVTSTPAQAKYSGVSAIHVLESGRHLLHELVQDIFLENERGSPAPWFKGALLGEGDAFLGEPAQLFGLGHSCPNFAMFDHSSDQVAQHSPPVGAVATKLSVHTTSRTILKLWYKYVGWVGGEICNKEMLENNIFELKHQLMM